MSKHSQTLAQIMGPSLITIGDDASVAQALQLARAHQVHHLPVLHGSDLAGLMCTCDVHDAPPDSLVAQWMSRPPVTLEASAPLQAAAQTMKDKQVGSVIVLLDGQPRGIVTRGDLLQAEPRSEQILVNARCECCGLTRHLSTDAQGHTFCVYCKEEPADTQRSFRMPASDVRVQAQPARAAEPHPLASLIRDHELIGQLAGALMSFSACVEGQPSEHDRADLASFARIFRELGDCLHHEKEETVLLPLLAQLGFDWDDGPLAEVRLEHCQERYLIDVLCQAADREGAWDDDERRRIAATASSMADFQRAHLLKENTVLFPVVMQRMSPAELRLLSGELRIFDVRIERRIPRAELTALAQDLIGRYLPSRLAGAAVQCSVFTLTPP